MGRQGTTIIDENGADPWVIKEQDIYYYTKTTGSNVTLYCSDSLSGIASGKGKVLYENLDELIALWAPEIHRINGKWYVYFAACKPGDEIHHMYVLVNHEENPFEGSWQCMELKGMDDKFAIDGTVLQMGEELYFLWSGWEGYVNVQQNIYIAGMNSPMEVKNEKILLTAPEYDWEKHGEPLVNEGPQIIINKDTVNMVYSASGSWTDDYCLGLLTASVNADFKNPNAWTKHSEPIFKSANNVWGPGHCSFVKSPDETETWIIYHAAKWKGAGWKRCVHYGKAAFDEKGKIVLGEPAASCEPMVFPSGEKHINKIILFTGGVETLSYFAQQLGREFKRWGMWVFYYDLKNQSDSTKKVRRFIKSGDTALLTFNFQGLSKEEGVYGEKRGYIWQEYNIPCFNIAVDHPYYYDGQLNDLPEKYVHISIDRLHERYFRKYYPEYKSGGFLPLAGTDLYPDEIKLPMEKREIDVLFPGNYVVPSLCNQYVNGMDEDYAHFYQSIIDELIRNPYRTVEDVAAEYTEKELGNVSDNDMRRVLNKMIFIDLYVRNYMRGKAVKTLAENGIKVHVIGKDWEKLDCSAMENIEITPFSDSETCMKAMRNSKIVINVMPWFKDGAHDRVFNAVLNGAVSVSDESAYQMEALGEGEGVIYYSLNEIESLPEKIRKLLDDDEKLQKIAERGYGKAVEWHTWKMRARQVIRIVEK